MGRQGRPSRAIKLPKKFLDDEVDLPQRKPPKVYCICRQPYDENGSFMIECDASKRCDGCLEWVHGHCVGISQEDAEKLEKYVCPPCEAEAKPPEQPVELEVKVEPGRNGSSGKRNRGSRAADKAKSVGASPPLEAKKEEAEFPFSIPFSVKQESEETAEDTEREARDTSRKGDRYHVAGVEPHVNSGASSPVRVILAMAAPTTVTTQVAEGSNPPCARQRHEDPFVVLSVVDEVSSPDGQEADITPAHLGVQDFELSPRTLDSHSLGMPALPRTGQEKKKLPVKRRAEDVLPRASSLQKIEDDSRSRQAAPVSDAAIATNGILGFPGAEFSLPEMHDQERPAIQTAVPPGTVKDERGILMKDTPEIPAIASGRVDTMEMDTSLLHPGQAEAADTTIVDEPMDVEAKPSPTITRVEEPPPKIPIVEEPPPNTALVEEPSAKIPRVDEPPAKIPRVEELRIDSLDSSRASQSPKREVAGSELRGPPLGSPRGSKGKDSESGAMGPIAVRKSGADRSPRGREGPILLRRSDSKGRGAESDSPRLKERDVKDSPRSKESPRKDSGSGCAHAGCRKSARAGQWYCSDECAKAAEKEALARMRQREASSGVAANKRRLREPGLPRSSSGAGKSSSSAAAGAGGATAVDLQKAGAQLDSPKGESGMRQKLRESLAAALALGVLILNRTPLESESSLPKEGVCVPATGSENAENVSADTKADVTIASADEKGQEGMPAERAADGKVGETTQVLDASTVSAGGQLAEGQVSGPADTTGKAVGVIASDSPGVGVGNAEIESLRERATEVATQVEEEMFLAFGGASKKYRERARSLLFNLKDSSNPELRRRVMAGEISPQQLAQMTPEQLASKELSEWRNAKAELHAQQVVLTDADINSWRVVKKTHKGEVEVVERRDDMAAVTDAAIAGGLRAPRMPPAQDDKSAFGDNGENGEKTEQDETTEAAIKTAYPVAEMEPTDATVQEPVTEEGDAGVKRTKKLDGDKSTASVSGVGVTAVPDVPTEPIKLVSGIDPPEPAPETSDLPPIMSLDEYMEARGGRKETQEPSTEEGGEEDMVLEELSYSPINCSDGDAETGGSLSQVRKPAAGSEEGSSRFPPLWEGKLQVGSVGQSSVYMLYQSGEKLPVVDCMRDVVEVKGRVRLSEMDRFLADLRSSRSRAVMMVAFVANAARDTRSLQEVAGQYRMSERVGFVELNAGGELYLLPAGTSTVDLIYQHGHADVVEDSVDQEALGRAVLLGALIRRRASIPSYAAPPLPVRTPQKPIPPRSALKPAQKRSETRAPAYNGPPGFEGCVISRPPKTRTAPESTPVEHDSGAQLSIRAVGRDPRKRPADDFHESPQRQPTPAVGLQFYSARGTGQPMADVPLWGRDVREEQTNAGPEEGCRGARQALPETRPAPQTDADDLPEFQFDEIEAPSIPSAHRPPVHAHQPQMLPRGHRPAMDRLPYNAAATSTPGQDALLNGLGAQAWPGPGPPNVRPPFGTQPKGQSYVSQIPESHVLGAPLVPAVPRTFAARTPRLPWQDPANLMSSLQQQGPARGHAASKNKPAESTPGPGPSGWAPPLPPPPGPPPGPSHGLPPGPPPNIYGAPQTSHLQPSGGAWDGLHQQHGPHQKPPGPPHMPPGPPAMPPGPLQMPPGPPQLLPGPPQVPSGQPQHVQYDSGPNDHRQNSGGRSFAPSSSRWPPLPPGRDYSRSKR